MYSQIGRRKIRIGWHLQMETASNSPFWAVITSILYYTNLDADSPWEWIFTDDIQCLKGEIFDNMRAGLVSCFTIEMIW